MTLPPEEEAKLRELRRKKAKLIRDQKRQRKYTPRLDSSVQKEGENKQ
jgi:hypothetical protein